MTWGEQNSPDEAAQQLTYALESGINFMDTAEMYPFPGKKETQGNTERILGNWLQKNNKRKQVVLATKIAGPNRGFAYIRPQMQFTKKNLTEALHQSLKRLQTDYIDLYQLHWPERNTNYFGQRSYKHYPNEQWSDNFEEVLDILQTFVAAGKIRYAGVSNENPYGLMRYMEAHRKGKIKIASVQNSYNLLNRTDEIGLTEILHREQIGYLAYSPLAFGKLTGKYLTNAPANARVNLFPKYRRYHSFPARKATEKYAALAAKYEISFPQMALAFIRQQPFVTATILGATTLNQLKENLASQYLTLPEPLLEELAQVHNSNPNPAS